MNVTEHWCFNYSIDGDTENFWELPGAEKVNGRVSAAFMLLFFVVGLPWNILVVITILWKKLYYQPTIMLLLNLVSADILLLVDYFPGIITTGIAGEYIIGHTSKIRCYICLFTGFTPIVFMLDSLFVIALMAIDRFLFIYKPLQYELRSTTRRTLVAIAAAAILSTVLGFLSFTTENTISFNPLSSSCDFNDKKYWYVLLLLPFCSVALIIIIVCNVWVASIALKSIKKIYKVRISLSHTGKMDLHCKLNQIVKKESHEKQLHLIYVFCSLSFSNIIAWLPTIISALLGPLVQLPLSIVSISQILLLSQVAVHPIIETILISDVRKPLKDIIVCGLLKKRNDKLMLTKEPTRLYSVCCGHARKHEEKPDMFCISKLIGASLLPLDISSNISTHRKDSQEKCSETSQPSIAKGHIP